MLLEIDRTLLLDTIKTQDLQDTSGQAAINREHLADEALKVVRNGFADLDLRQIEIRGNLALCVRSNPHLVALRCLNRVIRQAIGIQPSDRDAVIRRLNTVLSEGVPHRLYKFDIKQFFESIDVLELFGQLSNEPRIPRNAVLVLENFLYELVNRNIVGLPRGIQLSATLSEYALKRFDRFVSRLPEVYYYARYVDDIVIVTAARESRAEFELLLRKALPPGLRFNRNKTKCIDIPVQSRSDGSGIVGDFDYLGYNFSIHETKRVDQRYSRDVDVTIAPKKIRRLKSRVCRAVASFIVDGDAGLLERRLQLLTGNYNLRDLPSGRLRNVGLYCNYRRANSNTGLVELDSFLRSIFVGEHSSLARRLSYKMPYRQRRSFLRFSFSKSFASRVFYNFRPNELSRLTLCWRDAT
ncbi:hypothetical protein V1277_006128 [Bradyrhizobium sp. AZCC 1588]|uniref:antiviral reverse transcriptase Drt3a n=1 Tax=unclassified Bradyrhizobium TaxID=2631580 RepID=UPI002FEF05AD